jgi:hypothetical protein
MPGGRGGPPAAAPNRSAGRFPDGADTDSNCADFQLQAVTTTAAAASAGSNNIKVASVTDFAPGQTILIDTGANQETAVVATVGTQGATTLGGATPVGATTIPVSAPTFFIPGQTITIDSGANQETAVVVSGGGGRGGGARGGSAVITVTISTPLARAHEAGAQIAGTGITVMGALAKPHENGAPVASDLPTPGAPNRYAGRR